MDMILSVRIISGVLYVMYVLHGLWVMGIVGKMEYSLRYFLLYCVSLYIIVIERRI